MRQLIFVFIVLLFCSSAEAATQTVKVQVAFSEDTEFGTYSDALYYTLAEFQKLKQEDIDAQIAARVQKYIDAVKNAAPPLELTKDQLQEAVAAIERQKLEMEAKKTEFEQKIEDQTPEIVPAKKSVIVK